MPEVTNILEGYRRLEPHEVLKAYDVYACHGTLSFTSSIGCAVGFAKYYRKINNKMSNDETCALIRPKLMRV